MARKASDFQIHILSESGEKVAVPKSLLIENSPVIKAMLENITRPLHVLVLRESLDCLVQLKRFLRQERIGIKSLQNAFNLHKIAHSFKINNLFNICRTYIKKQINPTTLLRIFKFALQQEDKFIEYYCWIEFDEKCDELLKSEEFSRCDEDIVRIIVSRPKYKTLKEITLFQYLIKWASTKLQLGENSIIPVSASNSQRIRQCLNPFFNMIRFSSMKAEELEIVFSYHLLTSLEETHIRSPSFEREDEQRNNLSNTICSTDAKRTDHCYKSLITYENRKNPNIRFERYINNDTEFCCSFIAKANCFLYELILPIIHYNKGGLCVTIKIQSDGISIYETEFSCSAQGVIRLSEPLFIKKNIEYFIEGILDQQRSKYPIRIAIDAEIYMNNTEYNQLGQQYRKLFLHKWDRFFIKIKLYF